MSAPGPSIAIVTSVYNEAALLPIWLRYYGGQLGAENLFVIDDGSTDGSTAGLEGINLIRQERAPLDEDVRARTISLFHAALLRHHDVVIFTDVDEFLIVDPLLQLGLADYLGRHAGEHTNALGFNLIHDQFREPAYSPQLGVFEQRRHVQFDRAYCKQLVHRSPVDWTPGFHRTNHEVSLGIGLYLFHLRALDYELSRRRIRGLNELVWSDAALGKSQGEQFRMTPETYLSTFFHEAADVFKAAAPEAYFNDFVMEAAAAVTAGHRIHSPEIVDLQSQLLTVPRRFRNLLPAADAGLRPDADRRSGLPAAEAARLYFECRDAARHGAAE